MHSTNNRGSKFGDKISINGISLDDYPLTDSQRDTLVDIVTYDWIWKRRVCGSGEPPSLFNNLDLFNAPNSTTPWGPYDIREQLDERGNPTKEYRPGLPTNLTIGEVQSCSPLPEMHFSFSDFFLMHVSDGMGTISVISSAPNCRVGLRILIAKAGATLPRLDDSLGPLAVKPIRIGNVFSNGVACAARDIFVDGNELGLIEFPEFVPIGSTLADAVKLSAAYMRAYPTKSRAVTPMPDLINDPLIDSILRRSKP